VLFTQPNGTLSMIRTEEVDLDRSAVETQRAREVVAVVVPPEPKREPVLRLTEKDFPPMADAGTEDETAVGANAGAAVSSGLEVVSWDRTENESGDGVEIFGTVRNAGSANVTSPTLVVTLYDSDGKLLATAEGRVNAAAIPPGKTANFRAVFPGLGDFSAARFDAQGKPFATFPDTGVGGDPEEPSLAPVPDASAGVEGEAQPVENELEEPPPAD
jgi:hypothetical protein